MTNTFKPPWQVTCLTLFPESFKGNIDVSIIGRARQKGIWSLETLDIRKFADNKHANVDDTPAGGGAGMVMRADVAAAAIDAVKLQARPLIHLSPRGKPLTQERVQALSEGPGVVMFCGRFEGLDERVIRSRNMEEISLGDYVLAGGEVAAMTLIEACVRLLPGVAGNQTSLEEESFTADAEGQLLEYPQYTRPRVFEGEAIPEVLLSGDHKKIAEWRRREALKLTRECRPDLLNKDR